jgi:hypothetical protein
MWPKLLDANSQTVIPYAELPLPQLTSEDQIQYLTPKNIHAI